MKKLGILIVTFFLTIVEPQVPMGAYAQQVDFSATANTSFVSKHLWRGFLLSDDSNVQPSINLSMAGISIGYWGSYSWEGNPDPYSRHETHIGYEWNSDPLTFTVGSTHYTFPTVSEGKGKSDEFWFGAQMNAFLSPSLTAYFDIGKEKKGGGDGQYYLCAITHTLGIDDGLDLNLGAGLGYNNKLFIDENGFADFTPSAELLMKVTDHFSISLKATYSTIIDNSVEKAMDADNEFVALLTFHVA